MTRHHFRYPVVLALAVIGQLAYAQSTHQEHIHGDDLEARLDARDAALQAQVMHVRSDIADLRSQIQTLGGSAGEPQVRVETKIEQVLAKISEALTFSYSYVDDGSCTDATHALSGEYRGSLKQYGLAFGAYARVAPTGGDCRQSGITYRMSMDKDFPLGEGGWSATARFLADSRSTSATYALMDEAGEAVLLRADGNALLTDNLPAGVVDTVVAALGITRAIGDDAKLTLGGNIVPVDWSDGSRSQTVHIAYEFPIATILGGKLGMNGSVDVGNFESDFDDESMSAFGVAALRWQKNDLSASLRYAFGLNEVDGGEPAMQSIEGTNWQLQGSPLDDSLTFEIGVSF